MNRDDDLIGRLEDYLDTFDGVTPLPDRVRDAVRAGLPSTRQVRPARGPERMLGMVMRASTPARWGLVAAVLVAAVAIGAAVVNNNGRSGPNVAGVPPAATPSPSTEPTPTPAPTDTPLSDASEQTCPVSSAPDCIAPGRYRLTSPTWPAVITLEVPAGWFRYSPAADVEGLLVDSEARDGSGWGFLVAAVGAVPRDPCDPSKGTFDAASTATVDGVVAAMQSWPGFEATPPTAIEVGGLPAQLVELTSSRTAAECGSPFVWTTPLGYAFDAYPLVNVEGVTSSAEFRIVDVNGTLVAIRATDFPGTSPFEASQGLELDPTRHADDQAELHAILDSIRIGTEADQP